MKFLKTYKIIIDEDALLDLTEASAWYEKKLDGLGTRFSKQVKKQINSLKNNPFICEVRYKDIRCFPIKKFPFMIHYQVNENHKLIKIYSIFHTSRNPTVWNDRN